MASIEKFLSYTEEQAIVEAIRLAELDTSGEIRVHIENTFKGDVTHRALEVFHMLKMDNTRLRNAVLIYVAVEDKTFAIYGDKGINTVVADNFWDAIKEEILFYFKTGDFKQGLVEGITKAGAALKSYFPYTDDDTNELTNEISKG